MPGQGRVLGELLVLRQVLVVFASQQFLVLPVVDDFVADFVFEIGQTEYVQQLVGAAVQRITPNVFASANVLGSPHAWPRSNRAQAAHQLRHCKLPVIAGNAAVFVAVINFFLAGNLVVLERVTCFPCAEA